MPSPEHDQVVEFMKAYDVAAQVGTPIAEQRAAYEAAGAAYPLAPGVVVTPLDVPGPAGAIHAEWVDAPGKGPASGAGCAADSSTPAASEDTNGERDRALLYLHGGGYVIGGCATHRELASRLSIASEMPVLLPEYRLAPENPFPAALDDALACWRYLVGTGIPPSSMAIGGDSAGGGLTVALLLRLIDGAISLPAAAFCLSPWIDLTQSGATIDSPLAEDPIVSRVFLAEMAGHYLGSHDPRDPYASPLYGELSGLPSLLVQAGTAEVLLDDARRLVRAAVQAGVDVTLHEFEGLIHVFQAFAALAPESSEAVAEIGEFVRKHVR